MNSLQDVINRKHKWETPQDEGKVKATAVALAAARNKEMREEKVHGFAKVICKLKKGGGESVWQVRKIVLEKPPNQQEWDWSDVFSRLIASLRVSQEKIEFLHLLPAIQKLSACIYQNEHHLANSAKIIRALNKLMINLLGIDTWPLKNKISEVIDKFQEYQTHCQSKDFLEQNQVNFNRFVSVLNKVLKEKAMSIEDISDKIVTKLRRELPQGDPLFGRVQKLIELGIKRIYWPKSDQDDAVIYFAKVLALHAYVYKKDADNQQAKELLKQQIDRFLDLIIAYDHQNNSSTLQRFFDIPLKYITWRYQGRLDSLNLTSLGALIWTFEALVNNRKFIEYMQSPNRQINLQPDILQFLFLQESTWEIVMNLITSLENFQLFKKVIEARIHVQEQRCLLNENQLSLSFLMLNQKMKERKNEVHQEMYCYFLNLLSQINHLHFLKSFAEDERHIQILRENLSLLGFSFMTSPVATLPSFFGNATYRAIKDNRDEVPVGENVRFALLRLFSKCGKNPVKVEEKFNQALQKLLTDFRAEGFEVFCEEILGSIGEGIALLFKEERGHRTWIHVEDWLFDEVIALYQILKKYTLLSLPMKWQMTRLDDRENNLDRLCLLEDNLYTIQQNNNGEFVLRDLFTFAVIDVPRLAYHGKLLLTELMPKVQSQLKDQMSPSAGTQQERVRLNRRALSRLTEKYMLFHHDKQDKQTIQRLLDLIIRKMIADQDAVLFADRLELLAEFLNAMSPVLGSLESLVKVRFFTNDQKLKLGVARELVKKAKEPGEELNQQLPPENNNTPINFSLELVSLIARLLSQLCAGDIEKILNRCSLVQLRQAAPQLEAVVERKVNELSYETGEFITSFLSHETNKAQVTSEELRDIIGDLPLKEEVIREYGDFLKDRPIPVYFLLPNQALAIQLCLSPRPALEEKNLLIKMGTGQGKSLLIALTALNEARKIVKKEHSVVFVFTSYDHLAQRDHDLGKDFFRKENIPSICISQTADIKNFNSQTKIVYADVETIEEIIREIMLKWLQNKASEFEKKFIRTIFRLEEGEMRIILDEYDLLLHDLHTQNPKISTVPTTFLSEDFVKNRNNQPYCDFLAGKIQPGSAVLSEGIDPSSGKRFSYVPWYKTGAFNLAVAVMRLSTLIQKATRVIGFSGTASLIESHQLPNRLYFEMPSSQNPTIFETKILAKGEPKPEGDQSVIACHTHLEMTESIQEVNGLLEIPHRKIEEYCNAVINDIKAIRKGNENVSYQRPILIFADKLLRYKKPNSRPDEPSELLWDKLVDTLRATDIPLSFLPNNVSDLELQEIAREGRVTLTTIENGRGADIRVNSKIEEGLHVMICTSVIHHRLLHQLIGRTGRMGRKGSYSIITLGNLIKNQANHPHTVQFCEALHELTKLFVKKLSDSPQLSVEDRKRWMLFFTKTFSTRNCDKPQINLDHAKQFYGECSNNKILHPFFN